MTIGLLDLSVVTDRLITQLKAFKDASALWTEDNTPPPASLTISGLAPDVTRKASGCQLSVYLFHVSVDRFHRNTYPTGGSAQTGPRQPFALDLYFLVTACSDTANKAYIEEQQAMSIALKFFHENPRIVASVPGREEELTVTFEPQTPDELGRLWQALTTPLRLSTVYRGAVAFIEPMEPRVVERVKRDGVGLDAVPAPILATVNAPGGRATVVISGAGFGPSTAAYLGNASLTRVVPPASPSPGEFLVVDDHTLDLRVPAATPPRGHLLLIRPAADAPTIAAWLVVS